MKQSQLYVAFVVLACVAVLTAAATMAGTPKLISYQGRATDASGNPVADGSYSARFTILTAPTGGTLLWGELGATVTTTNGLFTYLLGTTNPIPDSLFAKYDSLFLQVMFNGQNLSPRTPLVSTGYAMRVNSVDGAAGGTITGKLTVDGTTNCWIDPNATGMNSAYLPDGAINDREIYDEPGIAQAVADSAYLGILGNSQDLVTVNITIPSSGYVVLFGKARLIIRGGSTAWIQIDQTIGGGMTDISLVLFANWTAYSDLPAALSTQRVYYKALAGTYTFRLEGLSNGGAPDRAYDIVLTAMFIPTAYGTVQSLLSSAEAQDFQQAGLARVGETTRYKVDLRELELRAAKAEAEAERARNVLLEAKLDQIKDNK